MQLEVGKRYMTRDGSRTVSIIHSADPKSPSSMVIGEYDFAGEVQASSWHSNGAFIADDVKCAFDLVAEVGQKFDVV